VDLGRIRSAEQAMNDTAAAAHSGVVVSVRGSVVDVRFERNLPAIRSVLRSVASVHDAACVRVLAT
jgi:F-type H+/Na+-transporting ATPase subunit beta